MAEVANQNHDAGHGESRLPDRSRSCTGIALSPASLTVPVGWKQLVFFSLVVCSKNTCPPGGWIQAMAPLFLVRKAMRWQRKQPSIVSIQMTLQPNKGPSDLAQLIVGSVRADLQDVRIFVNKDEDRICVASAPSQPAASPGPAAGSGIKERSDRDPEFAERIFKTQKDDTRGHLSNLPSRSQIYPGMT